MERAQLKSWGKNTFQANYWPSVVAALVLAISSGGSGGSSVSFTNGSSVKDNVRFDPSTEPEVQQILDFMMLLLPLILAVAGVVILISMALRVFLFNPLHIGCTYFFRTNLSMKADLKLLGIGFYRPCYKRNVLSMLLMDLFIFLWSLLLVVPGIIKAYSYRLTPYIIADDTQISAIDAIKLSEQMMKGHKMEAFVLDLSFIGWHLLSILTLGILEIFYVLPYQSCTNAAFYASLKNQMPMPQQGA